MSDPLFPCLPSQLRQRISQIERLLSHSLLASRPSLALMMITDDRDQAAVLSGEGMSGSAVYSHRDTTVRAMMGLINGLGLEGLIGQPNPNLTEGMEYEHCGSGFH